jgi:hypothetical protein
MKKRWTLWIAARNRPRSIIPGNPDLKIYTSVIRPAGLHTGGEVAGPLPMFISPEKLEALLALLQ